MGVTIRDIARAAGVGTSTVSACLNGRAVRPENRLAVQEAVRRLGYIPNDVARGLKTHRSRTVGVMVPDLSNAFGAILIGAMEQALFRAGYSILVCDYRAIGRSEAETAEFLLSKMVDALAVIPQSGDGAFLDGAVAAGLPVCVLDCLVSRRDILQVTVGNREISRAAAEALLARGHRRIAMLAGNPSLSTAAERRAGFREALTDAGCFRPDLVLDGGLSVEGGYLAMREALLRGAQAVFAANYEMTMGALIALQEQGRQPGAVGFVGFDNIGLSRVVTPRLAMVSQPMEELGRTAARLLLDALENGPVPQTVTLSAAFDPGESLGGTEPRD